MTRGKQKSFGERIRKARLSLGLSQEALAEAADVSRDAVVRLERGDRGARVATALALARALKVPPAYLLGQDETDDRLADLRALLRDADDETYALVTAVARELLRQRGRPPNLIQAAEAASSPPDLSLGRRRKVPRD